MPRRTNKRVGSICIASLGLACASDGSATAGSGPEEDPLATAGYALGAVMTTVVYAPAKVFYAAGGAVVGSLIWVLTGGNEEAALGVFRPAMLGDYVITPDHLRSGEPFEVVGRAPRGSAGAGGSSTRQLAAVSAAPPAGAQVCTGKSFGAVHFATDDATLTRAAQRELDRVAAELARCPDQSVSIQGFTDATGSEAHNQGLSKRRARAVEGHLVQRGVARSRVEVEGQGESNPVSPNTTTQGRAANRRAEIDLP